MAQPPPPAPTPSTIPTASEYTDDTLGLVYYNYRHYNPIDGRWISRDPISENGGLNLFAFSYNTLEIDILGFGILDNVTYAFKVGQTTVGSWLSYPVSILDGELYNDVFGENLNRDIDFSEENGCTFNISVNGMANVDGTYLRELVEKKVNQKVYALDNPTNLSFAKGTLPGVGDIVQSLAYEIGLQDELSKHLAKSIQNAYEKGLSNGCKNVCINIYAHSQGTMVTRRALDYLKYMPGVDVNCKRNATVF